MTSLNFVPHVSYFTDEDEFWRWGIRESYSRRTCTSGNDSSEQQNLSTHPRAKNKCGWFLVFALMTMKNGKIAEKKQVHCRLCSTLSYSRDTMNLAYHIWKHHPDHLKDIEECSDTGLKELPLQATLNKVKPYPKDSHRHQILVMQLMSLFVMAYSLLMWLMSLVLRSWWQRVIQSFKYHQESISLSKWSPINMKLSNVRYKMNYQNVSIVQ